MTPRILMTTSFAALTAFMAVPAFADITADDVWNSWKEMGESMGQTYTVGSESRSGDTLKLTDLALDVENGNSTIKGTIPEVAFRETGDGKVEITMTEQYTFALTGTDSDDDKVSSKVSVDQKAMSIIASGTPAEINYAISADQLAVKMFDFVADGEAKEMAIDIDLSKLDAQYQFATTDMTNFTSTFSATSLGFKVAGKDDESSGKFDMAGEMHGLAGASAGVIPKDMDMKDMAAMLAQGYSGDGSFTYDGGNLAVTVVGEEDDTTNFTSSSKGGNLNFAIGKDQLGYGLVGKGVEVTIKNSSMPFPEVTAAYDEAAFKIAMPITKSDEAKDFTFESRVQGLTVSEAVWALVDPTATLPRDPATMIVSLKGKVKPLLDLLDPVAMEAMEGDTPFQVETMNIETVQLSMVGAEFKGEGALAFDNTKSPDLGGVAPMPTGKLNLSLSGANALMEKLKALGIIGDEETMMFGMFAGMLGKPGPTPDSLISEVEFKEGGDVTFNGAPMPF